MSKKEFVEEGKSLGGWFDGSMEGAKSGKSGLDKSKKTNIQHKKAKLSAQCIEEIWQKYIQNKHKELRYSIRESNTTPSVYITIFYRESEVTIRFSDHMTSKMVKTSLIQPTTRYSHILRTIENSIRKLKEKQFRTVLGALDAEKPNKR